MRVAGKSYPSRLACLIVTMLTFFGSILTTIVDVVSVSDSGAVVQSLTWYRYCSSRTRPDGGS